MLTIDAADEAIRHFIGLFQIAEDRGRMRVEYDRIKQVKDAPEGGPIEPLDSSAAYPYRPLDYQPDIPYAPPLTLAQLVELPPPPAEIALIAQVDGFGLPGQGFDVQLSTPVAWQMPDLSVTLPAVTPAPAVEWVLPQPGSVAVIAVQHTRLSDDDQFSTDDMQGGVVDPALIAARLQGLADEAAQMGIELPVEMPANEAAFREMAETFREAELPSDAPAGAETHSRQGDEVEGQYLDGQAVEERPDVDALMPDYRQQETAEREAEAEETAREAEEERSEDGPMSAGPTVATEEDAETDQGHDVIAGNNTLVNEVAITAAVIAAPVIVAGAGVYSYNTISQTNVWSDTDTIIDGADEDETGDDGAGDYRAGDQDLSLDVPASPGADTATTAVNYASYSVFTNPMPGSEGGEGEAPQYWLTATLEGSLISVNYIEQFNLMSDSDIGSVTIEADQTLFLIGENGEMNQISLTELGASFDLIIVDGQVINLNAIEQTNVMLDDDRIMVSSEGEASISSGDNLLINDASIVQVGTTSVQDTTEDMDDMLADAAEGEVTLPASVLNDPAFSDLEVVRVLHIQSDLVSVNIVRQTNVLGDSDQIEVYRDALISSGGEVSVVSGSNVLVNAASIVEFGVDATVYSGGETYSDALLYQAELVSTEDPLMPADMSVLASEAVLFLAEGMLGDEGEEAVYQPIGADADIPADAMETVLT